MNITVKVPDKDYERFKDMISDLGFELLEEAIPESHKEEVLRRIQTEKLEEMIPWNEAKTKFRYT